MLSKFVFVFISFFVLNAPVKARSILLSIGASNTDPKHYKPLKFANRDALRFSQTFERYGWNIEVIQDVTLDSLKAAFAKIEEMDLSYEDQFILYFSGHGRVGNDNLKGDQYLMLTDSLVGELSHIQSVKKIADWMENQLLSTKKALVISACNAGIKYLNKKGLSLPSSEGYSFAVLSASQPNGKAFESDDLNSCIFTDFLIKNLDNSGGLVEAFDKANDEFIRYKNEYNDKVKESKNIFGQRYEFIDQLPHKNLSESGVAKICINLAKCDDKTPYIGIPADYKREVTLNDIRMMGSSKLDIDGWAKVTYTSKNGKKVKKSVKIEPGKEYALERLLEIEEPSHALSFSTGKLNFQNNSYRMSGLVYKYNFGDFRAYGKFLYGRENIKFREFEMEFDEENSVFKSDIGTEIPVPLFRYSHWDFSVAGRVFASYIYSHEKLDKFYFKNVEAWDSMSGVGLGMGLMAQNSLLEFMLAGDTSRHYSDIKKSTSIDVSMTFGLKF